MKKKSYAEVAKICDKNGSSICEIREEKEIHAVFSVTPQTAEIMTTVPD